MAGPLLHRPNTSGRWAGPAGKLTAVAAALYPSFNLTFWRRIDQRASIPGLGHLSIIVLLTLGVDALVLTEIPWLLYPLTILSALTVMLLLSVVYGMMWAILLRRENTYDSYIEMGLVLLGGFATALVQIALIDLGRYLITGTWEGFHVFFG